MAYDRMIIVYDNKYGSMQYRPKHSWNVQKFMHCTGGSIAVTDIAKYISTFGMHGIEIAVEEKEE